ncbi:putative RNA polymerase II subunit B1 CTD phosphatase RPAP2 isoform X2 [Varanus komodoensis]|uniref:putative RNA polymerase II subunit B1 CTD phosphatase RPAP2 isoform X2 n=1 Tax=Varanus komodoensis TaxID=61221 RepID=UPI001CF78CA6|nr:putative RNA polymerase II subunit B1 CTD phosphatase RPAP2 isoform X2 [Varanus komodoensis]
MMAEEPPRSASEVCSRRRRAGDKQSSTVKNEDKAQRKAALEAAIRKKIEHERKALQIVERLLEDDITGEFLVECGKFITPSHYKDVVEERFIIKLCGYPICQNRLQNVPKQKYRISTKANKVYDITERKRFCSDFCYKASKYFEGQISKSPVWIREEERPLDIELLKEGTSGQSGKEVKLVTKSIKALDIENPAPLEAHGDSSTESESNSDTEQEFVSSVLEKNLASAAKAASPAPRNRILKKELAESAKPKPAETKDAVNEAVEQLSRCTLGAQEEKRVVLEGTQIARTCISADGHAPETVQTSEGVGDDSSGSQVIFLGVSQKGADHLKRLLTKLKQPGPVDPFVTKNSLLEGLTQTFIEWRTEETLKLLSNFSTCCRLQNTPQAKDQKEELDEDDLDIADELDVTAGGGSGQRGTVSPLSWPSPFKASHTAAKALPSYEKLKAETSQLELKVREFYAGKFTVAEEDPAMQLDKEQQHSYSRDDQQWVPAFPLVDSNAQLQIRMRIVLEKLQNALPAVLGPLQISLGDVYSELKALIKTFRLTNTNIIHKAPVWILIAVVLLSVYCVGFRLKPWVH